jgi:hypothetical protein
MSSASAKGRTLSLPTMTVTVPSIFARGGASGHTGCTWLMRFAGPSGPTHPRVSGKWIIPDAP